MRESLGVSIASTPQSGIKTQKTTFRNISVWFDVKLEPSGNNFTFEATVGGEDRESLGRMFGLVVPCFLFLLILSVLLCVYIRGVCVSVWPAGLCVSVCFTSLFMWRYALCPAVCVSVCAHVAVRFHRRRPSIRAQSPLYTLQHLQHHVHHDEMSILLHTQTFIQTVVKHSQILTVLSSRVRREDVHQIKR